MSHPAITDTTTLAEGRFLQLDLVSYTDSRGTPRRWEVARRRREAQAVFILATLRPSNRLLLIRQYRVPVGAFCLEVPAGLIDDGETPEQAARRELLEETGYTGTLRWCGPAAASSAGLTSELVTTAVMDIDETLPENQRPRQRLDDGEELEVFAVPQDELGAAIAEATRRGDVPDSRLVAWATGLGLRW